MISAVYIKILQIAVPFISALAQLVFGTEVTTANLKKGLQNLGKFMVCMNRGPGPV